MPASGGGSGPLRLMPRPAANPARAEAAGPVRLIGATWAASRPRGERGRRCLSNLPQPPGRGSGGRSSSARRRGARSAGSRGGPLRQSGAHAARLPSAPAGVPAGGSHLPRATVREGSCPPSQRAGQGQPASEGQEPAPCRYRAQKCFWHT